MIPTINPAVFQKHIKTTEDTIFLLSFLSQLNNELFKKDRTLEQILEKDISYQQGLTIKKIAAAHQVNLTNPSEVVKFLKDLSEAIQKLPVVHLTFAFPPKADLVTLISQWFIVNLQQVVVLEISVDPAIMGGCIVSFNGKRQDYSLKKRLFTENQDKLQEKQAKG